MKKFLALFSVLLLAPSVQSQVYDANHPPNKYQDKNNPYYWKNRKPYEGYWQQDVYYKIKASVDEKTDLVDGSEELTYWNNSPDTLHFVYFHLYNNAFIPGSYLSDLYKNNGVNLSYGKKQEQGLGITASTLKANGIDVKTE